jgi:hypothetical protein
VAISPAAIVPGTLPGFKIYVRSAPDKYVLWALEGDKVRPELLNRLSEGKHTEIFVDIEETFKYEDYLETNLGGILGNQLASDDQKATILTQVSTNVVKAAFETSGGASTIGESTLQRAKSMVENAMQFITEAKSIPALAKMIGHDYETYKHATKVLWFTVAFLQENPEILAQVHQGEEGFDGRPSTDILRPCGVGALLHDIGKAFVPVEILRKDGPLTELEWEIMKRHPLNGVAMLLDTDIPTFVKKAVLLHHEDYQGGGYPMNLKGQNIAVLARVLRIIDTFDAMTSRRPYKDPIPPLKALQIMIGSPPREQREPSAEENDRDQGMKGCFDEELLKKFIAFLGNAKLS